MGAPKAMMAISTSWNIRYNKSALSHSYFQIGTVIDVKLITA